MKYVYMGKFSSTEVEIKFTPRGSETMEFRYIYYVENDQNSELVKE